MLTGSDLAKFGCDIDLKSYMKRIYQEHPKSQVTFKHASPSSSVCTEKGRSYSDVTTKFLTNGASLADFADWNRAIIIENSKLEDEYHRKIVWQDKAECDLDLSLYYDKIEKNDCTEPFPQTLNTPKD